MAQTNLKKLQRFNAKLTQMEKMAVDLKEIGKGVPFIEKNARNILSTIYVLKFGITDIIDVSFD